MSHSQVQALNYSAHALKDMRVFAECNKDSSPKSVYVMEILIKLLEESVKFILPNCCNLIDPTSFKQSHIDRVRLPYPVVAFEAPWELEKGVMQTNPSHDLPPTKRIALCWEVSREKEILPGESFFFEKHPEGGINIVPISFSPKENSWTVLFGGLFLPHLTDQAIPSNREIYQKSDQKLISKIISTGKKSGDSHKMEIPVFLPEFYNSFVKTYGEQDTRIFCVYAAAKELSMVVQACNVLNCANVVMADVPAPVSLNKKRLIKGKQPFFSYKVLQLSEERREAGGRLSGTGTHSSPRTHLRRGHLRQLENKMVWVRPALVNAGSDKGMLIKDYAVGKKG